MKTVLNIGISSAEFDIDWSDKAQVIKLARKLDGATGGDIRCVVQYTGRPNYNITHLKRALASDNCLIVWHPGTEAK